ncbi:MAG: LysR family transcriptional regulator [Burkholderiales bacterium]|nr:LysR family transcriptional regulator [Burkholderiales bacterium]
MIQSQTIELLAVLAIHQNGSFTAAAETLGLTPSALSKAIDRLEQRLGARLFERTTRRVLPTAEGERFVEYARRAVEEIAAAEDEISGGKVVPRGVLRMHVGTAFAHHSLLPVLPAFLDAQPQVEVELTVTDHFADPGRDAFDLAIRTGALRADLNLVAHPIATLGRVVCAAPPYLAKHGIPKHPDELVQHQCLTVAGVPGANRWPFRIGGESKHIEVGARVRADSAESVLILALASAGIARLTSSVAAGALACGNLVPLLAAFHEDETLPLTALYPPGRQHQAKVKAMLGFLDERFGRTT